jgi:hypothetical protein
MVNNVEIDRYKRAFAVPRVSKYLVICIVKTVREYVRRQGSSEMGCKSFIAKGVRSSARILSIPGMPEPCRCYG